MRARALHLGASLRRQPARRLEVGVDERQPQRLAEPLDVPDEHAYDDDVRAVLRRQRAHAREHAARVRGVRLEDQLLLEDVLVLGRVPEVGRLGPPHALGQYRDDANAKLAAEVGVVGQRCEQRLGAGAPQRRRQN